MKKILIVLFFVGSIWHLTAQEEATIPSFVPESPNAAAFSQYVDVPVGLYTGVPNISVPLYTVKSGEIELPITLSYHASGIKVAQEASWVGLGWALSTGGMISREVRGMDDFFYNGFGYPFVEEPANTQDLIDIVDGVKDSEADIFHYNFLGYSGKLIIEKQLENQNTSLKATPLEQNNLVFLYVGDHWEVTDAKGWKYFFNTKEITGNYSGVYPVNSYPENSWLPAYTGKDYDVISGWHIDHILTPNGDEITFQYENILHQTRTQVRISETYTHPNPGGELGLLGNAIDVTKYSGSMQKTDDVYLEKIVFKNGYIDFIRKERVDMVGINQDVPPQRLDFFEVFDNRDTLIKKVDFKHTYFNEESDNPEFMRLKLDAVQESNGSIIIPAHKFTYNTLALPSKKSLSIDHWGFYNGADNDFVDFQVTKLIDLNDAIPGGTGISLNGSPYTSKLVKTSVPNLSVDLLSTYNFTGANRESDAIKMQAGILTSIQYPTGGVTNFAYESHDYSDPDNPYYKEVGNTTIKQVWFAPYGHALHGNFNQEEVLNFTEETLVSLEFIFEHLKDPKDIQIEDMEIVVEKGNGDLLLRFIPDDEGERSQATRNQINFPPGQYVMRVENQGQQENLLGIKIEYKQRVVDNAKIGGGIRVKSIETKDVGEPAKKKVYEYDDNGISHGRLVLKNRYWHLYDAFSYSSYFDPHLGTVENYNQHSLFDRTSSSLISQNIPTQGSPVAYNVVKVSDVSSEGVKLGETKSYFDNTYYPRNFLSDPSYVPGIPVMMPYENGQLRKEEMYNSTGTIVYQKEIDYSLYPIGEINPITNLPYEYVKSVKPYFPMPFGYVNITKENVLMGPPLGRFIDYYTRYEWRYPSLEIVTTYDENGGNPVTNTTNYFYENVDHKMITKTITKNSKDETIVSNMEYPSDYPVGTGMSTTIFDDMVADNIISPVIKQNVTLNGAPVSTQINSFKNWDVDNDGVINDEDDILLPEIIKSLKGEESTENLLQDRIVFQEYTINGRVKKVKKADGSYIYYIWGYSNEYPIAKIDNLGQSTISQSVIDNLKAKSNEDNDRTVDIYNGGSIEYQGKEGLLREALNNLRLSFPNAMVSTYTYDPLIGVTSMTDPRGYTIYYEYDDFNRLKEVRDEDGKLVTDYEYHYKGQQ